MNRSITMKLRILKRDDVLSLLPMRQAIERMRTAFAELSAGRAVMPLRSRVETEEGDMLVMPAYLPDSALCVKAVLTYPGNRQRGLPVVQGVLMAFDPTTGRPLALMDCEGLTAMRTGAAGGLAIELLSRRDSRVLGVIGAGVQAGEQVRAAMLVRDIRKVYVFDKRRESAERLRDMLAANSGAPEVVLADGPGPLVSKSDIVITATTSPTPTFDGRDLRAGTHVNAIGSYRPETREVDSYTVDRAYVVADSREACMAEAGDLIMASRRPDAELGEVINGEAPGRVDDRRITLFKSVGLAVQDAAAASWVLAEAERQGVGTLVDL